MPIPGVWNANVLLCTSLYECKEGDFGPIAYSAHHLPSELSLRAHCPYFKTSRISAVFFPFSV